MVRTFKPKILARVTVPVLKMRPNRPYYIRFEEAIHEGERLEKQKYDNNAQICKVFDFELQEVSLLICRTVMKKEIERFCPGESYVGKSFELIYQNHPNPEIKYKLFTISQIAEPSPEDFSPVDTETGEITDDDTVEGDTGGTAEEVEQFEQSQEEVPGDYNVEDISPKRRGRK